VDVLHHPLRTGLPALSLRRSLPGPRRVHPTLHQLSLDRPRSLFCARFSPLRTSTKPWPTVPTRDRMTPGGRDPRARPHRGTLPRGEGARPVHGIALAKLEGRVRRFAMRSGFPTRNVRVVEARRETGVWSRGTALRTAGAAQRRLHRVQGSNSCPPPGAALSRCAHQSTRITGRPARLGDN